jgi:hypothetical protein
MDPNETLSQLRAWSHEVIDCTDGDDDREARAALLFDSLDHWLSQLKGFKPQEWK